jgi:transcriptional regulator with XRE-family HTH domain
LVRVKTPYPSASTLGAIIRRQRELAELPMRQLAAAVGISNPYLSQIERGLRAPSEAVLNAIADSLETTAEALYTEAGFVAVPLPDRDEVTTLQAAIDDAVELTQAQRRALAEIYRAFREANTVRRARASASSEDDDVDDGRRDASA